MDSLLYTATSGASRVMQAQQVRANNLSNADTPGFRADLERVQSHTLEGMGYAGRSLVQSNSASTRFDSGDMIKTNRTLDVAIRGEGFFAVETPAGDEAYTRAGNFELDQDGVMTVNGFAVLADDGLMVLPEYESLSISDKGVVSIVPPGGGAEMEVGQLKRVRPELNELQKGSDGLLHPVNGEAFAADEEIQLAAGYLEGSNVSAIDELMNVMSLTRNFEMQVRMMKTAETLAQAGNRLISNR